MTVAERTDAIPTGVKLAFESDSYVSRKVIEFLHNPMADSVTLFWTNEVNPNTKNPLANSDDRKKIGFVALDINDNPDTRSVMSLDGFGNGMRETIYRTRMPGIRLLMIEGYGSHKLIGVIYKFAREASLKKYSKDWENLQ